MTPSASRPRITAALALAAGLALAGLPAPASGDSATPAPSASAARKEIRVNLFGQPCAMSGPVSESVLTSIHAISPEQVPPSQDANSTREALEKVKKTAELPPALDSYKERLVKRLEAQAAFLAELTTAARTGKSDGLAAVAKKNVQARQLKEFNAQLKKLATKANLKAKKSAATEQLIEAYNDAIEPHPEEDFHRAIGRIGITYSCSFDESEQDHETDEAAGN